jgi:hypothetical protein
MGEDTPPGALRVSGVAETDVLVILDAWYAVAMSPRRARKATLLHADATRVPRAVVGGGARSESDVSGEKPG